MTGGALGFNKKSWLGYLVVGPSARHILGSLRRPAARRREFHNLPFGRDLGFHGGWGGRGDISSLGGGWGLS